MAESSPERLTASEARDAIAAGTLTSEQLLRACLGRIVERDGVVGAWAHLNSALAVGSAKAADAAIAEGKLGPLSGIPIAIKDIIDTHDMPTEYGSPVFTGRQSKEDAFVVTQLRKAGAVIIGKTVTTELAFFGPGKTRNPRDPSRTPGGSSSGSAAAVADFQVPLAIGTQTAGSVIRPASYCGVIGFKPTFGYVSRTGVLPQSAPLDTIGGYARSIADIALLFDSIGAYDVADRNMLSGARQRLSAGLEGPLNHVPRLAFIKSPAWRQGDPEMRTSFEAFAGSFGARAEVVETALPPEFDDSLRLQQALQFSDIARNYGPIADAHPDMVSQKLKDVIAEGRRVSSAYYAAARADQEALYDALRPILVNYDAILTPAAAGPALKGLSSTGSPMFNGLWTYLGMPCISLPLLKIEGLPVGVQLTCGRGDDAALLRVSQWMMRDRAPKS